MREGWLGVLKHSKVRFQEDVVSVREFTGFVWRKGEFMGKNIYGFQKYQNSLGCGLKQHGN